MRVLLALSSLKVGGAEHNVVSVLPHLQAEGIDLRLCTLTKRNDSHLADIVHTSGVPRFDADARRLLDPRGFRRFLDIVRSQEIEIVHAEDQYTTFFGALAARLSGARFVFTRHNVLEEETNAREWVRNRLVVPSTRGAARGIAVSHAVAAAYRRLSGLTEDRIVTVHNGIDLTAYDSGISRMATRAALGWAPKERILIFVAVMRPDKGHDILFKALPAIQSRCPDVRLVLVGGGTHLDARRREAAPLGDRVQFLGQRDDVPQLLEAADLFVSPSRNEGLPTVVIEAGAAGLPAVATNVGGTSEIVEDGVTGFLVPSEDPRCLADAVVAILADTDRKQRMGAAASTRIRTHFTLQAQARKTAAIYREVIRGG